MTKRKIDDVLDFRSDFSPFLVHLTRNLEGGNNAKTALESIIYSGNLKAGHSLVSSASYGVNIGTVNGPDQNKFFSAICFTETPLNEIHCLLDVSGRKVELEPYGLVFLKDCLRLKGVSPVLYLNNEQSDKAGVLQALCSLMQSHPSEAAEILPLVSFFGSYVTPLGQTTPVNGKINFLWEREWRYPANRNVLPVDKSDVFLGICPHHEIDYFENIFSEVSFVDPRRNLKWYATKLVAARKQHGLSCSVV